MSGKDFNMNFLLLTIQSVVCVTCVITAKRLNVRDRVRSEGASGADHVSDR